MSFVKFKASERRHCHKKHISFAYIKRFAAFIEPLQRYILTWVTSNRQVVAALMSAAPTPKCFNTVFFVGQVG